MRIILPTPVTPAALLASNIPEDDHPAWGAGVTYARGARVVADHGVWESVADGNTGHDPAADVLGSWWLRIGATNRWRAFDERIGGQTVGGHTIAYSIRLPRTLNRIAFFNLDAASVRVRVTTPAAVTIHDRTVDLVARDPVGTFWEYVFTEFAFTPNVIVAAPLPAGATLDITVTGGAVTRVGEIVMGRDTPVGTTVAGTGLGLVDYSVKQRDEWGGLYIVPRPVTRTVSLAFQVPLEGAARVQSIMERVSSRLAVFYAGEGVDVWGTTVAGILRDYDLTLGHVICDGRAEVESLA
jgi:hypothetical protein